MTLICRNGKVRRLHQNSVHRTESRRRNSSQDFLKDESMELFSRNQADDQVESGSGESEHGTPSSKWSSTWISYEFCSRRNIVQLCLSSARKNGQAKYCIVSLYNGYHCSCVVCYHFSVGSFRCGCTCSFSSSVMLYSDNRHMAWWILKLSLKLRCVFYFTSHSRIRKSSCVISQLLSIQFSVTLMGSRTVSILQWNKSLVISRLIDLVLRKTKDPIQTCALK